MPIYDLQCVDCRSVEEKLFTCIMNFITEDELRAKKKAEFEDRVNGKFKGFEIIGIDLTTEHTLNCEVCGGILVLLPSLPAMQPDKYWAGQMVHGQYTTSSSFVKRYEKQNNLERVDRSVFEEVQKKQENRIPEAIKKTRKPLHDIIAKEVTQLDLPND